MDTRSPAFQFYPKDFLTDGNVAVMSLPERGAYITLLCICWTEGSLPADLPQLARLCGVTTTVFQRLWPAIEPCFRGFNSAAPGRLIQPRLEREREKQAKFKELQSQKGRASAESRKATAVQPEVNRGSIPVAVRLQPEANSSISDLHLQTPVIRTRTSDSDAMRAGDFLERYNELHKKHRHGAPYMGKMHHDFQEALQLVSVYDDRRLDTLATIWLTTDHDFAEHGTRTVAKFRSMISWCDERARKAGL